MRSSASATTARVIARDVRRRRTGGSTRAARTSVRASGMGDDVEGAARALGRRDALRRAALGVGVGVACSNVSPALALSGMNAVKDTREGYEFLYPVGWQEIQVDGQQAVYKDIIEPLESVALNVYPTQRKSVAEIGTAEEVAKTLVGKALTAPGAAGKVLATSERTDKDGHLYYQFEFVTKTKSYERHALTVVTVTQGKFYTLTTGSSEKRWGKMKERLNATVGSFNVYY